uniref:OR34 n=1 Tax=synthetic construct TaxID=32630 RepID=UPI00071AFAB7|nr:Chain A, OR34 [synthetic construct]2N4E_A Chain A, OR34 [synthetic construct]
MHHHHHHRSGDIQVQNNNTCNGKTFDYTYTVTTESELQKVLNELKDYIKKQGCKRSRTSITARTKKEAEKFAAILIKVYAELGYNDINVTWDGDTVTVEGQLEGVD